MEKFNRNYLLSVQKIDGSYLTVSPPFTLEFDIQRSLNAGSNQGSIRVLNLNANSRNSILKNYTDTKTLRNVTLSAGYGLRLPVILNGWYYESYSVREGIEWISQIECYDFFSANSLVNIPTFQKGTNKFDAIKTVISNMPGVTAGYISPTYKEETTSKANSYSDNAVNILNDLTSNCAFSDNGKVNCIQRNEYIATTPFVINSASGLLQTPLREGNYIKVTILFEPTIKMGQIVQLDSTTGPNNTNLVYKIYGISHKGTISEAVCGDATTTLTMIAVPQGQLTAVTQ